MRRRAVAIAVIVLSIAAGAVVIPLRSGAPVQAPFLGYVEAQTLLVGAETGGRLIQLAATEGAIVAAQAPLFALDALAEEARVTEATARLGRAKAQLADLEAARQRPEQIEVLRAGYRRAAANLELSRTELRRQRKLFARGMAAQALLDQARMAFERDRAALAQIAKEIEAARLAARDQRIEAARAQVATAEARLRQARTEFDKRKVAVPRGGRIVDVFYRAGEVVTAGQPVVEILPPENVRVRFYVPETRLADIAYGDRVSVACDGCPRDLAAVISFIAPQAEFTPPVIFTREERAKLVFMIEATPLARSDALKPGLPVEVMLADVGRGR